MIEVEEIEILLHDTVRQIQHDAAIARHLKLVFPTVYALLEKEVALGTPV